MAPRKTWAFGGSQVDGADDGAGGRVDDLDVAGGSAQVGEAGVLGASGVPEVSGGLCA